MNFEGKYGCDISYIPLFGIISAVLLILMSYSEMANTKEVKNGIN